MIIVCVESVENSFLFDYLSLDGFADIPIFSDKLIDCQLKNFWGFGDCEQVLLKEKTQNDDGKHINFSIKNLNEFKLFLLCKPSDEFVLLFKSDYYFELDVDCDLEKNECVVCSADGEVFLKVATVKEVRDILLNDKKTEELFHANKVSYYNGGYTKKLENTRDLNDLLLDKINNKTLVPPPMLAEGIFAEKTIPSGDFTIIPPIYIGENVQIESGSVIGPNVVLYEEVFVARNSKISDSILLKDVFVSSHCSVFGGFLCENSIVKRKSIVANGSVLGKGCVINENVVVSSNSKIKPYVTVGYHIKLPYSSDSESVFDLVGFPDLSPENALLLGKTLGTLLKNGRVGVADDGNKNSLAVKLSIISGLLCSDAECIDFGVCVNSRIFFYSMFCDADLTVYIRGGETGTGISIYNRDFIEIGMSSYYNLINKMNLLKKVTFSPGKHQGLKQFKGLKRVYYRAISSLFYTPPDFRVEFICSNAKVKKSVNEIFDYLHTPFLQSTDINFTVNDKATKAFLIYKNKKITHQKLLMLAKSILKKRVDLPGYFFELYRKDALLLAFIIISEINCKNVDLNEMLKELPQFFIRKESLNTFVKPENLVVFLDRTCDVYFNGKEIFVKSEKAQARILKSSDSDKIDITVKSKESEAANKLFSYIKRMVTSLDNDCN